MRDSILKDSDRECYLCGKQTRLEEHHIVSGVANRKLSERYGLKVHLCHDCHVGKDGVQYNAEKALRLKKDAQRAFEKFYGHENWMAIFKKNYL